MFQYFNSPSLLRLEVISRPLGEGNAGVPPKAGSGVEWTEDNSAPGIRQFLASTRLWQPMFIVQVNHRMLFNLLKFVNILDSPFEVPGVLPKPIALPMTESTLERLPDLLLILFFFVTFLLAAPQLVSSSKSSPSLWLW